MRGRAPGWGRSAELDSTKGAIPGEFPTVQLSNFSDRLSMFLPLILLTAVHLSLAGVDEGM